jgi:hypothetical protein
MNCVITMKTFVSIPPLDSVGCSDTDSGTESEF